MSLTAAEKQITDFIITDRPEVLVIKGDWGVGKTFTWDKIITREKLNLKLNGYCYVSLFGLDSIESLRKAIFQHTVNKEDIGIKPSLKTLEANWTLTFKKIGKKLTSLSTATDFIPGLNGLPISPAIDALAFMSISKMIICLDDLERAGKNLDQKEVLGLVSLLKEQRDCKVVLLLNDNNQGMEDYHIYREKLIDQELEYAPTSLECARIAFGDQGELPARLSELTNSLNIRNIRILLKIKKTAEKIKEGLVGLHPKLLDQIFQSLVIHTLSFYCARYDESIPPISHIKNYLTIGYSPTDATSKEIEWNQLLDEYKFNIPEELDEMIKSLVTSGYFNSEKILEDTKHIEYRWKRFDCDFAIKSAWQLVDNTLENNEMDVIDSFKNLVEAHSEYLRLSELDRIVWLIRKLNKDQLADYLVDSYLKNSSQRFSNEYINRFDSDERKSVEDAYLSKRLFENHIEENEDFDPINLAQEILHRNSLSKEDETTILSLSESTFYNEIKRMSARELISFTNLVSAYTKAHYSSEPPLYYNFLAALNRISDESPINKLRLSRLIKMLRAEEPS